MSTLRDVFPAAIGYGGLQRADDVAVGVVVGGAPAWDLVSEAIRNERGRQYHQLLLALDGELHIYVRSEPVDLADPIVQVLQAQAQVTHPMQARILGELADCLAEATQPGDAWTTRQVAHALSHVTHVLWALPVRPSSPGTLPHLSRAPAGRAHQRQVTLRAAVQRAHGFATMLARLGGTPDAALVAPEELLQCLYASADPQRSHVFPLTGSLLERIRPVINGVP